MVVGVKEIYPCSGFVPFPLQYFVPSYPCQMLLDTVPYTDSVVPYVDSLERCFWGSCSLAKGAERCLCVRLVKNRAAEEVVLLLLLDGVRESRIWAKEEGGSCRLRKGNRASTSSTQSVCVGGRSSIY